MPSWTSEDGFSWFGKDKCKRCGSIFDLENDEIPEHNCINGRYKSMYLHGTHRYPVYVGPLTAKDDNLTLYENPEFNYVAKAERKKVLQELLADPTSFFKNNFTEKQINTIIKKCKF